MYDLGAGKIVSRLQAHQHDIQNMVFSPDGKLLASYDGQEVIIWDLTTRSKLASFVLQREYTFSDSQVVTFTPDSRRLVTLDDTHQLRLRQADTGAVVAELGPANPYSRLIFSPDGSLLVVSDPLRIIKLATGEVQPLGYGFDGNWLHFSPDGATLVVGDYFTASTLVFGIPTQVRPIQWQPTKAHIRPSSINVRSAPDENAPVIAQASGDVQVAGQNLDFVYLPEFKGWVLSDKQYLDLGSDVTTVTLPFISSPEDWTKLQAAAQQTSATSVPASPTPVPSATLPTVSSCMVTTRFGVNLRTGPGQGYDKAGSAPAGQALTATKQTKGADGFTWWQLDTGEWVREDLVLEAADCTALPSQ
jgi:hypothetical protein